MPYRVTVEQGQLAALAKRLGEEADGAKLRRELARNLRAAATPTVSKIRAGAQVSKRSGSVAKRSTKKNPVADSDVSLGAAIARSIGVRTKMGPRSAGVNIRATKAGMPRGFRNAPKWWNRKGWRHPVFGRKSAAWVVQVGNPDFFDGPTRADRPVYRAAAVKAMSDMAERIAK